MGGCGLMRPHATAYLACPSCGGALELAAEQTADDGHVMEGTLVCRSCGSRWPVRGGVPRLVREAEASAVATAARFATEWQIFGEIEERYRRQFLDWIAPFGPQDFKDKVVLEGGCGKGRHTRLLAEWGARAVVAVDLGDAVDVAFANTRDLDNVHVVQMDLVEPAIAPAFDVAVSVGVLHHLPDPERGFRALVSRLRPGGRVITWTYGLEGNEWIVRVVNPVRTNVTSRLPSNVLMALTWPLAAIVWAAALAARRLGRRAASIPAGAYLAYIGAFPFREVHHIVFDQLTPPIAWYLPRGEIDAWYRRAGLERITLEHHNRTSWRGSGTVPETAGVSS